MNETDDTNVDETTPEPEALDPAVERDSLRRLAESQGEEIEELEQKVEALEAALQGAKDRADHHEAEAGKAKELAEAAVTSLTTVDQAASRLYSRLGVQEHSINSTGTWCAVGDVKGLKKACDEVLRPPKKDKKAS